MSELVPSQAHGRATMAPEAAVLVDDLVVSFEETVAVGGVSFAVAPGG